MEKKFNINELRKNSKGTFVLVHGAGVGGWVFRDVAILLRAYGYNVFTPTLTGLGEREHLLTKDINLSLHAQDIINHIKFYGMAEVFLVGHSYGGAVISVVADKMPINIKKQIYLDS
ncbi:MAG: alpha/beta fold hydrolase, partial [Fusobacteriaceae bacterium]